MGTYESRILKIKFKEERAIFRTSINRIIKQSLMRHLLILGFLFATLFGFAQKSYEFSSYLDKYPTELQEFIFMNASKDRKKEFEPILIEFGILWQSDTLNDANKKQIVKMSNMMSQKRFRPNPTFIYFAQTIMSIARDSDNVGNIMPWLKSMDYYIKRKKTAYMNMYLQSSKHFFKTHYISDRSNKTWKVSNGRMSIGMDNHSPIFIFPSVDITGFTTKDSTYILRTSGTYFPMKDRWKGNGGRVFWTRLGVDTNTVFALVRDYKIDLKTTIWRADSVTFYDRRKFDFPLEGRFRDKFGYSKPSKKVSFPFFESYRHDLILKEVFKDVDYKGGYSLQGLNIIGSGAVGEKAHFIFKNKGKGFVWTGAQTFVIEEDKILSEKVDVAIYIQSIDSITGESTTDSIYHPGLSLYYSNAKRTLSIYRKDEGLSQTPFFDSYHNIDLYVEELNWKLGEDFIDMKSIQQKGIESRAYFESINMFSNARYEKLQGLDRINPVLAVYNFTEEIGYNEFTARNFGEYMHMGKSATIAYLMNLATKGFLIYDTENDYVIVKENVRIYVKAHEGKSDYDVIGFNSKTNGLIPNASLNLRNNDILIQGVKYVFLSDSQDVRIFPKHGLVELKKNRDFVFSGKIQAGRFDLYAHDCYFSYDKFEIDLPAIDSLSFKVESFEENDYGEHPLVRVKTVIEDLKGNLLIDHPNNKSGRESFPEYPILNSKTKSYVYYEKSNIFNKVYKRDKFFYRLESFVIDSLDDFKTDGLEFEGYLASAGIFPDIEQPLKVQPDYSLGFKTTTGESGYGVYGGVGRYTDSISLSNMGLRGNGNLKFLTSTSYSKDFVFFPDSTNATLSSYSIEEKKSGVEYPPVVATNVYEHWEPYNDLMNITTLKKEEPFEMYNKEAKMLGTLSLSSQELGGDGTTFIKNAEMNSKVFIFKNRTYDSESCMFQLNSFAETTDEEEESLEQSDGIALQTEDDFIAKIDFDARKGDFESKTGSKKMNFAENMYICFMDQFTWYMDQDKTEFSSKDDPMSKIADKTLKEQVDLNLSGTQFISTNPTQDSINFFASSAVYLQRKKLIHASGVPRLFVADAAIEPESHELKVRAKAEMDEITNAKLLVNRETKNHLLYNGTFKVRGLHDFSGRALYDYKDVNGNIQNIFFGNIHVDTANYTVADAQIENNANFTLSKFFDFVGDVHLVGYDKYLTFTGGTRINHTCDTTEQQAIRFTAQIDPANIRIPIGEDVMNMNGNSLLNGIKAREFNGKIYPSFLNMSGKKSDNIVMQSFGYLVYDDISQEYRIASSDKLDQRNEMGGNYLSLSRRECSVYGEGKLDVAYNTGSLNMDAYGKVTHYKRLDSTSLSITLPLDFYFNDKALDIFAEALNAHADVDALSLESDIYKIMLLNKFDMKRSDQLLSKIRVNGEYNKIPKELVKTIYLSDIKMKYNPRTHSLVSTTDIGIVSVGKTQILKTYEGRLEIKNKGKTYKVTLAIDLGNKEYFYFQIKGNATDGQVLVYSSNNEFNTLIKEAKSDDRKLKTKGKEPKFRYYISTPTGYKKFMRMMQMKE